MTKAVIIAVVFAWWGMSLVSAQAVSFRLEIPAGAKVDSRLLKPAVKDGIETYMWVELATRENIQLLVSIRDESGNYSKNPFYFLNDGGSDFANAYLSTRGFLSTTMRKRGTLLHNYRPKTNHFSSWIGVPAKKGMTTTIEYF